MTRWLVYPPPMEIRWQVLASRRISSRAHWPSSTCCGTLMWWSTPDLKISTAVESNFQMGRCLSRRLFQITWIMTKHSSSTQSKSIWHSAINRTNCSLSRHLITRIIDLRNWLVQQLGSDTRQKLIFKIRIGLLSILTRMKNNSWRNKGSLMVVLDNKRISVAWKNFKYQMQALTIIIFRDKHSFNNNINILKISQ